MPRIRISRIMALVAVVALNLAAVRALSRFVGPSPLPIGLWGWGALLMLNFLGAVILMGLRNRWSLRFVLGFEVFGLLGIVLYLAETTRYHEQLRRPLVELFLPLFHFFNRDGRITTVELMLMNSVLAVVTALPQLASALLGGFLFRNFRLTRQSDPSRRGQTGTG